MGDTWAALAWSGDAIDLVQKNPNIGAIVPRSGTAIFADLWVQPSSPNQSVSIARAKLSQQWIDYCLQPKVSNQISLLTASPSPSLTSMKPDEILPDIRKNSLILPSKNILDKSEFIYPLSATSKIQYDRQWQAILNKLKVESNDLDGVLAR
jgi:putative spermidine/putrescine transport system substrate-binding protein